VKKLPRSSLMYRTAKAQQQKLRDTRKALRIADRLLSQYVPGTDELLLEYFKWYEKSMNERSSVS
jgi:hypothetical protein